MKDKQQQLRAQHKEDVKFQISWEIHLPLLSVHVFGHEHSQIQRHVRSEAARRREGIMDFVLAAMISCAWAT